MITVPECGYLVIRREQLPDYYKWSKPIKFGEYFQKYEEAWKLISSHPGEFFICLVERVTNYKNEVNVYIRRVMGG